MRSSRRLRTEDEVTVVASWPVPGLLERGKSIAGRPKASPRLTRVALGSQELVHMADVGRNRVGLRVTVADHGEVDVQGVL